MPRRFINSFGRVFTGWTDQESGEPCVCLAAQYLSLLLTPHSSLVTRPRLLLFRSVGTRYVCSGVVIICIPFRVVETGVPIVSGATYSYRVDGSRVGRAVDDHYS
jgi:hypothetical protein